MSFLGALFGSDAKKAANRAAQDTYTKQQAATTAYDSAGDAYQNSLLGLSGAFHPYSEAGSSALQQLLGGLGLGGAEAGNAFTAAYRNLPGYQAGMDSGIKAVNSTANARGMLNSGANEKALYRYGSDYENQRSGDYLSRLMGLAGMGQQATGQEVGTAAQGYGGKLQQRGTSYGGQMNSAGTIGQGMVAGANAESSALGNILGVAGYLGGSALGSPWLGSAMGYGTNLNKVLPGGKPLGFGGIGSA